MFLEIYWHSRRSLAPTGTLESVLKVPVNLQIARRMRSLAHPATLENVACAPNDFRPTTYQRSRVKGGSGKVT
jgi:hypothetical protein